MTMYFNRAELMDDVAFHRCVRYKVWEKNKQVSFVPPDGKFTLLSFRSKGQIQLPLLVEPKVTIGNGGGEIRVRITPRDVSAKPCQDVFLEIRFPRIITSATLSADAGRCQFDDTTKVRVVCVLCLSLSLSLSVVRFTFRIVQLCRCALGMLAL